MDFDVKDFLGVWLIATLIAGAVIGAVAVTVWIAYKVVWVLLIIMLLGITAWVAYAVMVNEHIYNNGVGKGVGKKLETVVELANLTHETVQDHNEKMEQLTDAIRELEAFKRTVEEDRKYNLMNNG